MMTDLAARGKAFLGWTKVWVSASSAQIAKWEQFALGVYLLGRQSASYLDFMPSHSADNTVVSYSNLTSNLGAPLGPYTMSGSMFTRNFQNGKVTVTAGSGEATLKVGLINRAAATATGRGSRARPPVDRRGLAPKARLRSPELEVSRRGMMIGTAVLGPARTRDPGRRIGQGAWG